MAALESKHGTLEDFTAACDSAFNQLFITWDERNAAVEKYRLELKEERQQTAVNRLASLFGSVHASGRSVELVKVSPDVLGLLPLSGINGQYFLWGAELITDPTVPTGHVQLDRLKGNHPV